MSFIHASSLSIDYAESKVKFQFPDLVIEPKDKVLLLGPSGSGKSTFLSIIAGLLAPSTGTVHIHGQNIFDMTHQQRDVFRGKNFGFVFQDFHLIQSLTLIQNINLTGDMLGIDLPRDKVDQLLKSLGLEDKINRKPSALSHGEQQRVALARALIHGPSIVIADEPTSALDDKNTELVMDLFESHVLSVGSALLVATHDKRIKHRFDKVISIGA